MKSTSRLARLMNTYMSQIIQQDLPMRMQSQQNMSMLEEDDNVSKCFGPYKNEEYTLDKQDLEKDHRNLVGQNLDTGNLTKDSLLRRIPQYGFFACELSLF